MKRFINLLYGSLDTAPSPAIVTLDLLQYVFKNELSG